MSLNSCGKHACIPNSNGVVGDGQRFQLLDTSDMTREEKEDFQARLPSHLECHGPDAISDRNYYQLAVPKTANLLNERVAQTHPALEGIFSVCLYPNSVRSVSHRACKEIIRITSGYQESSSELPTTHWLQITAQHNFSFHVADKVIHGIAIVGGRYVELEITTTKEEFAQLDDSHPIIAMQCTSWSCAADSSFPRLQTNKNTSSLFNIRELEAFTTRYLLYHTQSHYTHRQLQDERTRRLGWGSILGVHTANCILLFMFSD